MIIPVLFHTGFNIFSTVLPTASIDMSVTIAIGVLLMASSPAGAAAQAEPGITVEDWGTAPDGTPVQLWTLTNANGMEVKIRRRLRNITFSHSKRVEGVARGRR